MSAEDLYDAEDTRLGRVASLQRENGEYQKLCSAFRHVCEELAKAESGAVARNDLEISQLRVRRAQLRARIAVLLTATLHEELAAAF
ncbi:hypothetical protein [uncultured Roseobacter sp.]|uniref:hypothetical protein n=1 Tax=uncultured Roseobacter sp. TaxID=114847 RepID=UPI002625FB40|nr:hypothetical protein [uncultured Roseobacter sp.]